MEGFVVYCDIFLFCDHPQVPDYVGNGNPVEVVSLAAGEDGRKDLMFLCGSQDEYCMCRWFLQGLEEGVEGRR